ncbi:MAG: YidC/Oxa1 family membrane protein insertase [Alicyclobacillus sp.]|nr:YidC/Oxa1 family membrane protein insertase [Alicyclobacillus sp.]
MYPSHPGDWPHGVWGDILKFVSNIIDDFARILGGSYGLALLVVTVLVRLLILPLMIKQIRYSKMMQAMSPQLKEIREKYRGDNRKIQEETMKLWQEHGVNPMSGCLPTLAQLPVLYALFGAIEGNIKLNHSTFLGIFHLGQPDHYFILPVLAAAATYLSSRVMMTTADPQSKMMLYIMPLSVLILGSRFASGLALYWIYSSLFTTVQTYFIRVRPAQADEAAKAAVSIPDGKAGKPDKEKSKPSSSQGGKAAQSTASDAKYPESFSGKVKRSQSEKSNSKSSRRGSSK